MIQPYRPRNLPEEVLAHAQNVTPVLMVKYNREVN